MGWTFTSDPAVYQAAVQHVLERDPVRNTVALTVLDAISHGQRFGEEPCTLGWFTDPAGEVTGAVSQTPPYGLLLTQVPGGTEGSLVAELRRRRVSVPDVTGERALAWRFGQLWGSHTELIMAQRLFELDRLNQPDPAPAGNPTPATAADVGLIMHWLEGFRAESEPRAGGTPRSMVEYRVERQLYWLWLGAGGDPVSMAGRNVTVAGVSRVGPVYTPPERRGRGYAAAVTAACTQHALATDADRAILFTDVANPTSNGIYQRLGYRPIADRVVLRLG